MSDDIYITIADAHPISITIEDAQPIDIVVEAGSGTLSNHNALNNLQGGAVNDYYHLLEAEYTELSNWLDDVTLGSNGLTSVPQVVLVPRASALSNVVGGLFFSSIDASIYTCVEI